MCFILFEVGRAGGARCAAIGLRPAARSPDFEKIKHIHRPKGLSPLLAPFFRSSKNRQFSCSPSFWHNGSLFYLGPFPRSFEQKICMPRKKNSSKRFWSGPGQLRPANRHQVQTRAESTNHGRYLVRAVRRGTGPNRR